MVRRVRKELSWEHMPNDLDYLTHEFEFHTLEGVYAGARRSRTGSARIVRGRIFDRVVRFEAGYRNHVLLDDVPQYRNLID